jgi:hypothetical protein
MTHTRKTKAALTSPVRCAIYTGKSTEEGLDHYGVGGEMAAGR